MPIKLKKRRLSINQQNKPNFSLGNNGEEKAIDFLVSKNFEILEKNLIIRNFEIDIIALDQLNNELVFFEVKTRKNDYSGSPSLAISKKKLRKISVAAQSYCQLKNLDFDYRIDAIEVVGEKINHIENISWLS